MLRKWEWIAEKCEELGFKRCGKLAKEIDKILCDTMGFSHTEAWEEDYNDLERYWDKADERGKYFTLKDVADSVNYCTACQITGCNCLICPFGKVAGVCADSEKPNKFDDFLEALKLADIKFNEDKRR